MAARTWGGQGAMALGRRGGMTGRATRSPRLAIPGTTNLRDVGGLPAAGGKQVARGRLYRGEVLASSGAAEMNGAYQRGQATAYEGLGLMTVFDLRSTVERERTPSAWGLATGAKVVEEPIPDGAPGGVPDYVALLRAGDLRAFTVNDLGRFYCGLLDKYAEVFSRIVRRLAKQSSVPALVHCSAGKDRTGLVVALVLDVLGTPREAILEDYILTGVNRPDRIHAYADELARVGVDPMAVRTLFESPWGAMEMALDHLDERYQGPTGYLLRSGSVGPEDLEALRAQLVE